MIAVIFTLIVLVAVIWYLGLCATALYGTYLADHLRVVMVFIRSRLDMAHVHFSLSLNIKQRSEQSHSLSRLKFVIFYMTTDNQN